VVYEGQGAPSHRGHVVHVGDDRRHAGAERIASNQRRPDRFSGEQQLLFARFDHRGVVAGAVRPVGLSQNLGHHAKRSLGPQRGQDSESVDHLGEHLRAHRLQY
jgi:hypothetical protein